MVKDILLAENKPPELAKWSWTLLNNQAPTKMDPEDLKRLIKQNTPLPATSQSTANVSIGGNVNGFVLMMIRSKTEVNNDKRARTVGYYYAFYNGKKLDDLYGMTLESPGPGNNLITGQNRRIEAGVYPLFTQAGSRYVTIGYSSDPGAAPLPAIEVGGTGNRQAILIHPGRGFLNAIGTINLTKPLNGPQDNIDLAESEKRVIAVIDAMKTNLGQLFPSTNGQRIPNAWLVILGEPQAQPVPDDQGAADMGADTGN